MNYETIYNEATEAGRKAGMAHNPTPMVVGQAVGLSNEIDYSKKTYNVPSGVCGFAWVHIPDARSGFAKWLKKTGKVSGRSYYGGYDIWIGDYGQSMERKEKHASAMAEVLEGYGIRAYAQSRMD